MIIQARLGFLVLQTGELQGISYGRSVLRVEKTAVPPPSLQQFHHLNHKSFTRECLRLPSGSSAHREYGALTLPPPV